MNVLCIGSDKISIVMSVILYIRHLSFNIVY